MTVAKTYDDSTICNTMTSNPLVMGYSAYVSAIEIDSKQKKKKMRYQLSLFQSKKWASTAESLLVTPEIDDLVLYVVVDGLALITQILQRKNMSAIMTLRSERPVEWVAPLLRFKALRELELLSANKITLSACHMVLGACQTLVQQAGHFIQNAKHFALTTKGLMRFNGKQQVITAEEDLRMDAKRINMG